MRAYEGKVALITGASRGIGKGIALVLVQNGGIVYITGRKHTEKSEYPSVMQTAEELNMLKTGKCIGMYCDHKNDNEVAHVFKQIEENHKRLDILVNNAFSGLDMEKKYSCDRFWEQDAATVWEKTVDVGMRSNYIASCMAAKIMVKQNSGLIVNISSFGGIQSLFNPVYGLAKEGNDRMVVEMSKGLKKFGVCVVSLWPGLVRTEIMQKIKNSSDKNIISKYWYLSEDVTFTGKAVLALFNDPNSINKTGKVHVVADLARQYGFTDVDGSIPSSWFSLKFHVGRLSPRLAQYIPHFIQVPGFVLSAYYSKF